MTNRINIKLIGVRKIRQSKLEESKKCNSASSPQVKEVLEIAINLQFSANS